MKPNKDKNNTPILAPALTVIDKEIIKEIADDKKKKVLNSTIIKK